jgi:hypothetical protein
VRVARLVRACVGEPLRVATLEADVQRLDNLSIFAQIGVEAGADGEGVRLTFRLNRWRRRT